MAVDPKLGSYISENESFQIRITKQEDSHGTIKGQYVSKYGPEGPFETPTDINIGGFSWVHSDKHGTSGVPPFNISFNIQIRPQKRPYCICDSWTGAYLEDNSLLMAGVRSYVNHKGNCQARSLGTMVFKLAK